MLVGDVICDGMSDSCLQVVLATGAWFDYLDGADGVQVEVPVRAVKGQMWITSPLPLTTLTHVIYTAESHVQWKKSSGRDRDAALEIPEYCTHNRDGKKVDPSPPPWYWY